MFRRVLLPMVNYPFPTLPSTIDQAVSLAQLLKAELYGLSLEMEPPVGLGYGYTMPFVGEMIAAEQVKAAANKETIAKEFAEKASAGGVAHSFVRRRCMRHEVPDLCAAAARFCDLSLLPIDDNAPLDQWYAEGVIFESGHPALVLPRMHEFRRIDRAAIAWDGSRAAIRSITDAIPLLSRASEVLAITATPGKSEAEGLSAELLAYLLRHGIAAKWEAVKAGDLAPTDALVARVAEFGADFLVMGAFGHSRLRDFILGGFTKEMLAKPPLPVFMSY